MLITFTLLLLFFKNIIIVQNIETFKHGLNNCNSSSPVQIDQNPRKFLLTPPDAYLYDISCEWKIKVNTLNETLMLKIDANLVLNENAFLVMTVCGDENILLSSNSLDDRKNHALYTQEDELCVKFTSFMLKKERFFFWSIYFKLVDAPMKQNVR